MPWMRPASELYDEGAGVYAFPGESKMKGERIVRDAREMVAYYEELLERFPIVSIEDGLDEDDWEGWQYMTERLSDKTQLVGDDLFVTNPDRLRAGIRLHVAQRHSHQSEPDRHPDRNLRGHRNRPPGRVRGCHFPSLR